MKKPQPTTKRNIKSKNSTIDTQIETIYAFKGIPVTQRVADKWAEELEQWVKDNPEAKTITQFIRQKEITRSNYYDLMKRHTSLATANENALRELGERLWGNAVDKKADWKPVHHMLHTYAPEFDQANKYHADLKKEVEAIAGNYIVKMFQAQAQGTTKPASEPKDEE